MHGPGLGYTCLICAGICKRTLLRLTERYTLDVKIYFWNEYGLHYNMANLNIQKRTNYVKMVKITKTKWKREREIVQDMHRDDNFCY